MQNDPIPYLHPLPSSGEPLPVRFTFPFRYTPHPLCRKAALLVQEKLREMRVTEGKMYGVLVVKEKRGAGLSFLAAYSGQLSGAGEGEWFVPPVVDYLDPDSYFQREQAEIVKIGKRLEALRGDEERKEWLRQLAALKEEREAAVTEAKRVYEDGKRPSDTSAEYIRLRQFQKANIHRAKVLHKEGIAELEGRLAALNVRARDLYEERKQRSEALQQWLFEQFVFLNGRGEKRGLKEIFGRRPTPPFGHPSRNGGEAGAETANGLASLPLRGDSEGYSIPSGAGECCAPKLLQTAYRLGLDPVAMAEFWWGASQPGHYREPGAFFPACHSKCRPILGHMLQGLNVEPDPAEHYEQALKPIRVLWEDESLAVIVKPEGWCSIPGRSDQANLFDEAQRLWPGISGSVVVHRLDMDTSGVMVLAKNPQVHRALSHQFELREVKKKYVALLEAPPSALSPLPPSSLSLGVCERMLSGVCSLPLAPDLENLPRQRVDWEHGKEAVTRYEVLGEEERFFRCHSKATSSQRVTRIAFYPQTGRTHQLRVHASSPEGLNVPIVGDRLYGHAADRLYLHAEVIEFTHPITHERLRVEAPCPF